MGLKEQVGRGDYLVDADAVAEAIVQRILVRAWPAAEVASEGVLETTELYVHAGKVHA